ncbi:RluA family pseudouridine synthase, partial [Pseudocitrobacter faecalis]
KNPQNSDSVHYRLVQQFPGCTLVHRLDFGTSGLMLVARNKAIDAAIAKDPSLFPRMSISTREGKPARSRYSVMARFYYPVVQG